MLNTLTRLYLKLQHLKKYFEFFCSYSLHSNHSYDILGARMLWKPKEARMLWKPKEARILKNFIEF